MDVRRTVVRLIALTVGLGAFVLPAHGQHEIDVFMEQVLERRQENWVRLHDYVLDERERVELVGPEGRSLWSFDHEYVWYVREGYLVRSPVRFDGVVIGEVERRASEEDWLIRERRRIDRPRPPRQRRSSRGSFENIMLTIERDWGARVGEDLGRVLAETAETRADDFAAVVMGSDAITTELGGVEAVGFGRVVDRTRDAFVLLEVGRLVEADVASLLAAMLPRLADSLPRREGDKSPLGDKPAAGETGLQVWNELDRLLELARLAARFDVASDDLDSALGDTETTLLARGYVEHARALGQGAVEERAVDATHLQDTDGMPEPDANAIVISPQGIEPRFVSEAFFLDFEFEPGNYFFAGRDEIAGREVVIIEYYPEQMFSDDGATVDSDDQEDRVEAGFDKTSLVTLWIDEELHQIVKFTFDNLGFDFLPGRWLVRLDDLTASMVMGQPFDGTWLPEGIELRGQISLATGTFRVQYLRTFSNYREAEARARIRSYGGVANQPE